MAEMYWRQSGKRGYGALEALKAWCDLRTGKTQVFQM
jgi:hypothetical protein